MKLQTSALRIALAATAVLIVLLVAGFALKAGNPRTPPATATTTQAVGVTNPATAQAQRTVVVANPLSQSGVPAPSVAQPANDPRQVNARDGSARRTNDEEGSPRHTEERDDD